MIRLAFLGCGRIARSHAKRLRRHRDDVAISFASRDPDRARDYARELGGRAHLSYDDAIASPDVDAVAIVTPPSSHLDLALQALSGGKHVVLEKPPLPRALDFDAVSTAAVAAERRVFVAENYHYKPILKRLRAWLSDGVIGDVLFIQVNAIKQQFTSSDWRFDARLALGGALYEGGIHWIDFLTNLGLEVRSVHAARPALPRGAKIERSMLVTLEYVEGAVATLAYSWEVPATARGLRLSKLYGREGSVTFETNGLWAFCHGRKTRPYVSDPRDLTGHRPMWADFVSAWKADREPLMTLRKARRDLELVEQAYSTIGAV